MECSYYFLNQQDRVFLVKCTCESCVAESMNILYNLIQSQCIVLVNSEIKKIYLNGFCL